MNNTARSWASMLKPARLLHVLPQGTMQVGIGLLIQGITAYAFLVASARALGPERYVGVSVLWALTFLVAFGLFIPLEQELARGLAARTATGRGLSVRQVALAGTWVLVAVLLATLLGAPVLLGRLFDHQVLLLVGLGISLPGYFLVHLVRGIFAGTDALARYGVLLAVEGCVRLGACLILAVAGSKSVGMYGLAFAVSPFVAVALTLRRKHIPLDPGTEASLATLSTALGQLVAGSVLSQVLVNGPVLALKILTSDVDQDAAGRLLAGLAAARVQLFLFSAVYIAVLPKLAAFASRGQMSLFKAELGRLVLLVAAIGASFTLAAFLFGTPLVRMLFGSDFSLSQRDLTFLTGANAILLIALTCAQALIALAAYGRVASSWLCGVVLFLAVTATPWAVTLRVEIAFLVGSIAAAAAMTMSLLERLRRPVGPFLGAAVHPAPESPPS